ncbi:MAG TPA: hypothetical protein VLG41_19405 [Hydrogenophaga sp.]|uniref:hypothetical protein n=1 Tax=Hydrogenophaga sp. TaxID=1904254 RepID=UPI002BE49C12|nr:hypothetical protein [Hydrogenophaga sp.]HSX95100.1 hypothetical protein [Hydrogenophaga sp.]
MRAEFEFPGDLTIDSRVEASPVYLRWSDKFLRLSGNAETGPHRDLLLHPCPRSLFSCELVENIHKGSRTVFAGDNIGSILDIPLDREGGGIYRIKTWSLNLRYQVGPSPLQVQIEGSTNPDVRLLQSSGRYVGGNGLNFVAAFTVPDYPELQSMLGMADLRFKYFREHLESRLKMP